MGMSAFSTGLSNLVTRAVIATVDSARKCQALGLKLIAGEEQQDIEHLEPYGFTSSPQPGAESVVLFPAGDRSHGVVIVAADRRYRLRSLAQGEVALYSDEGDSVVLKRGRLIEVTTEQLVISASRKVVLNTPLIEASGDYQGAGEIADGKSTLNAVRATFNGHTHPENGNGGGTTSPPNQSMS